MTEDEAKTKWCPFARLTLARRVGDGAEVLAGETVFNRAHDEVSGEMFTPEGALCIASQCMAWRTRTMRQDTRVAMFRDERRLLPTLSEDDLWAKVNRVDQPEGFCGLAGAPQ